MSRSLMLGKLSGLEYEGVCISNDSTFNVGQMSFEIEIQDVSLSIQHMHQLLIKVRIKEKNILKGRQCLRRNSLFIFI